MKWNMEANKNQQKKKPKTHFVVRMQSDFVCLMRRAAQALQHHQTGSASHSRCFLNSSSWTHISFVLIFRCVPILLTKSRKCITKFKWNYEFVFRLHTICPAFFFSASARDLLHKIQLGRHIFHWSLLRDVSPVKILGTTTPRMEENDKRQHQPDCFQSNLGGSVAVTTEHRTCEYGKIKSL